MHRRGGGILALALAALALAASAALAAGAAAQTPLQATVSPATVGQPMAPGFVGLSLEYSALHVYTGRDPLQVNPVFEALVRNLAPGQAPVLRIGGGSADATWWPVRGLLPPGGVDYRLTPGWLRTTKALASALGARLILGVNLAASRPALAAAEARAFVHGIGQPYIQALEIGNEPDIYNVIPWYTDKRGRVFFSRAGNYNFSRYLAEFARFRAALPPLPLAGPATAGLTWLGGLNQLLAAEPRLRVVTVHRYPLRACVTNPSQPGFPSIPSLLADQASSGLAQGIAPYVAVAHARGVPLRLAEMNSASCSGKRGVSDTFASALWALDTLFNLASVGVDGVNVHSLPGAGYELFTFTRLFGHFLAFVHPEYYGLMLFAQAFPPGAQLLQASAPGGPVKLWATHAPDGHTRVVLINKDPSAAHEVAVSVPGASAASLDWLTAPSAAATSGVTLGGQTFGGETPTGLLGPPQTVPISAVAGAYAVNLPPASAVMLTQ
ncbi:MAG: hypothetical protein JOZ98_12225 [Solirubrobacterales bacterium]|nr:hypothetical protein [Solirubrobacterales bacterium]